MIHEQERLYTYLKKTAINNQITIKANDLIKITSLSRYHLLKSIETLKLQNRIRVEGRSKYIILD